MNFKYFPYFFIRIIYEQIIYRHIKPNHINMPVNMIFLYFFDVERNRD